MGGGSLGFGSFGFGSPIGGGPPGGGSFLLSKHRLSLGDLSPEMIDAIATLEHFNASGSDFVGIMKLMVGRTSRLHREHALEVRHLQKTEARGRNGAF
jgi:hypothetical protein